MRVARIVLRALVAAVLLIAGGSKLVQIVSSPGAAPVAAPYIVVAIAELAVGGLIAWNVTADLAMKLTAAVCAGAGVTTVALWLSGSSRPSCNCFGQASASVGVSLLAQGALLVVAAIYLLLDEQSPVEPEAAV